VLYNQLCPADPCSLHRLRGLTSDGDPSLFDRLTDFDPRNSRVPLPERDHCAVKRKRCAGLTNLLNTAAAERNSRGVRACPAITGALRVQDFTAAP